jgi:hypothetical protein
MSDIQRWTPAWDGREVGAYADRGGEYVTYADHVEVLRQAVNHEKAAGAVRANSEYERGYEQAKRIYMSAGEAAVAGAVIDALAGAVQRVEGLIADGTPAYLTQWVWPNGPAQMQADVIAAIMGDSE